MRYSVCLDRGGKVIAHPIVVGANVWSSVIRRNHRVDRGGPGKCLPQRFRIVHVGNECFRASLRESFQPLCVPADDANFRSGCKQFIGNHRAGVSGRACNDVHKPSVPPVLMAAFTFPIPHSPPTQARNDFWDSGFAVISTVQSSHPDRVVPFAGGNSVREFLIDLSEIFGGECNADRADIFVEILSAPGTGDWHDVVPLRENPRKGELRRRAFLLGGNFFDSLDQRKISLQVLALEPRSGSTEIIVFQVRFAAILSRQESAPQRAVREQSRCPAHGTWE